MMASLGQFPIQESDMESPCGCRYQLLELDPHQGQTVLTEPLQHAIDQYQEWVARLGLPYGREALAYVSEALDYLALLEDSRLLCHACSSSAMTLSEKLRWRHLGLSDRSDLELFTIVLSNLYRVIRTLAKWEQDCNDTQLNGVVVSLDSLADRIRVLLDPAEGVASLQRNQVKRQGIEGRMES
ncbi:hypothetical protein ACGTN6_20480 [Halomonas sp. THAF12]|uniref:hypothetical protein n=1 Tax=Halomonas sp. B23F22_10 TaxID=3459515 RepID=UPI00373E103B